MAKKVRTFKDATAERLTKPNLYKVFLELTVSEIKTVISEAQKAETKAIEKAQKADIRTNEKVKKDLANKLVALGVDPKSSLNSLLLKAEPKKEPKKTV
jgi:DNA-binding transcriptional MerR regulator